MEMKLINSLAIVIYKLINRLTTVIYKQNSTNKLL